RRGAAGEQGLRERLPVGLVELVGSRAVAAERHLARRQGRVRRGRHQPRRGDPQNRENSESRRQSFHGPSSTRSKRFVEFHLQKVTLTPTRTLRPSSKTRGSFTGTQSSMLSP